MNGKVGVATRKRNQGKISSKVVRKDYDYVTGNIEKRFEEWDLYVNTRNIDTDDDLLED